MQGPHPTPQATQGDPWQAWRADGGQPADAHLDELREPGLKLYRQRRRKVLDFLVRKDVPFAHLKGVGKGAVEKIGFLRARRPE